MSSLPEEADVSEKKVVNRCRKQFTMHILYWLPQKLEDMSATTEQCGECMNSVSSSCHRFAVRRAGPESIRFRQRYRKQKQEYR